MSLYLALYLPVSGLGPEMEMKPMLWAYLAHERKIKCKFINLHAELPLKTDIQVFVHVWCLIDKDAAVMKSLSLYCFEFNFGLYIQFVNWLWSSAFCMFWVS